MHTCLLFFVWRCSSITHAHICKHAHASVNLFPYHPSQVASAQDRISIDLDIENERIGTGMLEPKRAFISDRMTTGESEVYKIEVLDPSSGNQKKATFIIQSHWQDDDHDMRETGVMFYRVIRTPPKVPTKKGVKLVKSPWEGATHEVLAKSIKLRSGQFFASSGTGFTSSPSYPAFLPNAARLWFRITRNMCCEFFAYPGNGPSSLAISADVL